ncbi:MAG: leucine-rich repeat protein [Clostridia bacterium]|nr:leucine-rich repeat protein [Clostridia bacterium]
MLRKTFFAILFVLCLVCAAAHADFRLPANITVIETEAFMGDDSLTVIAFPESLERIESKAFYGCHLMKITLPNSIEYIAPDAFDGNDGMVVVAAPNTVGYAWALDRGFTVRQSRPKAPELSAWLTDCYIVSWDAVPDAVGYRVYYGTSIGVTKSSAYMPAEAGETMLFINTTPGVQYYFALSAMYEDGETGLSTVVTESPREALPAPASVSIASATADGLVSMNWAAVEGAENYRVYFSTEPTFRASIETYYILDENATSLTLNLTDQFGASTDGTCYLWVAAQTDEGPGIPSARVRLSWFDYTVYQMQPPVLTQEYQDGTGNVTLSWNSLPGDYWYQVCGGRTGSTPRLITTTRQTTCTAQAATEGNYSYYVRAGLANSSGYIAYGPLSSALTVRVKNIWSSTIRLNEIEQTGDNTCLMTWDAISPVTRYEGERLYPNGAVETQFAGSDLSMEFDLPDDETYTYRVRAYYRQDGVDYYSPWSNTVTYKRVSTEEYAPTAPELTKYPSASGVHLYGDVDLAWIPNDSAQSVYVVVLRPVDGTYETIASYDCYASSMTIPAEVFNFIPANGQSQIRIDVGSEGVQTGDAVSVTFNMYGKGTILINNQAAASAWNRPYRTGATKTYAITASSDWTAVTNAAWLQATRDGNDLVVTMADNGGTANRTGTVTVSSGGVSQTITVTQGTVYYAPAFYLADGSETGDYLGIPLSQDQNNPTPVNYKKFIVNIDKNNADYIQIKWYYVGYPAGAVTNTGTWSSKTYTGIADNIGKVYCFEVSARLANNAAVDASDTPVARYYYILTQTEDFLLLDGQANATVYGRTSAAAKLAASDDVTWQSDASWITEITEEYRNTPKARALRMTLAENTTGANRTGHVTVTCGSKSGVITIIQIPNVPKITSPSLSTNSGSPTTLSNAYCLLTVSGTTGYAIEEYISSSWSSVMQSTASFEQTVGYVGLNLKDEIGTTSATKFRFVLTDDAGHTSYYYFKLSASSSSYVYLGTKSKPKFDTYLEFDAASTQTTKSFYMAASGSWTATSSASWLSISPASGSSTTSQSVTLTAQNNTTGAVRTAKISFKISGTVYAECKVTQTASDQVTVLYNGLPLSQTTALSSITPEYSSIPLKGYGSSTVTVTSNVSWITVSSSGHIAVEANASTSSRSGQVTFTCGSASKSVTLTQLGRLPAVTLTSHTLSTDTYNPTFLTYSDSGLTLKWNRVSGARKYEIWFRQAGASRFTRLDVNDTGASSYTYTIPATYFDPGYTGKYDFRIFAVDQYENSSSGTGYYFTFSVSGGALIDARATQTWNNANDLGDSKTFTIASSANWTASANASWIHLSSASGSSGAALTVTVDQNTGAQRTGKVTVTSGSGSAVLNITQWAALTPYAQITSPTLSFNRNDPTMLAKANSLTVTWQAEPQVGFYELDLCESSGRVVHHETGIKTNSFTFDTTSLVPGKIYMIEILRDLNDNRSGNYAVDYYFCYTPDTAFINVTSSSGSVMDDLTFIGDGTEENAYYDVESSGTWVATVSDSDWMMVSRKAKITAEKLEEEGSTSYDYRQVTGEDGGYFRLCLLANDTGASRSGTVTVTTPGASVTFTVTQTASYILPAITSPEISTKPSTAGTLPYGNIELHWNKGSGTTGIVTLILYDRDHSGVQVWKASNLSGSTATIPGAVLQERTNYKLRLETKINSQGETDYQNYYFRTGLANELALNATVDWSQALYGGFVTVRASAYGGAGGYAYAYQLRCDGQIEAETEFVTNTYYTFQPQTTGSYQLKVIARDQDNNRAEYVSSWEKTDTNVISVAVANQYVANLPASAQTLSYTVISAGTWTVTDYPYWVDVSAETGSSGENVAIAVAQNLGATRTGKVVFESSTGIVSTLTVTQVGSGSGSGTQPEIVAPEEEDLPPVDYEAVSVTLASTEIMVGENLVADVTAPGATAVRLVVDNMPYEEYMLENESVHVVRRITSAGYRHVQFQAFVDGAWGIISTPQILKVNKIDDLANPTVTVPSAAYTGDALTVTIGTLQNADHFTVLLKRNGDLIDSTYISVQDLTAQSNRVTISGYMLNVPGEYYVDVIATGIGYSQSETVVHVSVDARDYAVSILTPHHSGDVFVPTDTVNLSIRQSGGGYMAVKINDKWYPDETVPTLTAQQEVLYQLSLLPGEYTVTAYVFASDTAVREENSLASDSIEFVVNGPVIYTDKMAVGGNSTFTWIETGEARITVVTNNAADRVFISENGVEVEAVFKGEENFRRTFETALPDTAHGIHNVRVRAVSDTIAAAGGNAESLANKRFAIVRKVSPQFPVYAPNGSVTVISSPVNGKVKCIVMGGEWVEPMTVIGESGNWYHIRTVDKKEGFVEKENVTPAFNPSTPKIELLSPVKDQTIARNTDNTIQISWRSNLPLENGDTVYIQLTDRNSNSQIFIADNLYSTVLNASDLPDGKYRITARTTEVSSKAVEFVLGQYDEKAVKEQEYKTWFARNLYTAFENYDNVMLSMDPDGMPSSNVLRAAHKMMPYLSKGFTFNGKWCPLTNDKTTSIWGTLDDNGRKRFDLLVIGDMLKEDAARGNVKLNYDLSNVNQAIKAESDAAIVEARTATIFNAIKTTYFAAVTAVDAARVYYLNTADSSTLGMVTATEKLIKTVVETTFDCIEDEVNQFVKDYDSVVLLDAYKKVYAEAMRQTSRDYADYLETALFGGIGMASRVDTRNMDRLEESAYRYIQKFRTLSLQPDSAFEDSAVDALVESIYKDRPSLHQMICDHNGRLDMNKVAEFGDDVGQYLIEYYTKPTNYIPIIQNVLKELLKELIDQACSENKVPWVVSDLLKEIPDLVLKLVQVDNNEVKIDFGAFIDGLYTALWKYLSVDSADLVLVSFCEFTDANTLFNVSKQYLDRYYPILSTEEYHQSLNELDADCKALAKGFVDTIREMVKYSWKIGAELDELIKNASKWSEEANGKRVFELYACCLADSLSYHYKVQASGNIPLYKLFNTMSVQELETLRKSMIALLNNDEMMLLYLRNMRTVNEQAGWRFLLGMEGSDQYITQYDYPSAESIDRVIEFVRSTKAVFLSAPPID